MRNVVVVAVPFLVALAAVPMKAQSPANARKSSGKHSESHAAAVKKAEAAVRETLDLLHEKLLVSRFSAPITAELLSVSRNVNGKIAERKPTSSTMFIDDEIGVGWVVSPQQLSFVLENRTAQSMRLSWDNAVLVDTDAKNHRVIHAGVRMIDSAKPQPPSTILASTKLEDLLFPADLLAFENGNWQREPLFDWMSVGEKLLVLLPLDVGGQLREYTFVFRIRAADPVGLRDREHNEIIAKLGDAATLEQIVVTLKRQPDAREDSETSFGKMTRVTYLTERLVLVLLDGKLESIEVLQ